MRRICVAKPFLPSSSSQPLERWRSSWLFTPRRARGKMGCDAICTSSVSPVTYPKTQVTLWNSFFCQKDYEDLRSQLAPRLHMTAIIQPLASILRHYPLLHGFFSSEAARSLGRSHCQISRTSEYKSLMVGNQARVCSVRSTMHPALYMNHDTEKGKVKPPRTCNSYSSLTTGRNKKQRPGASFPETTRDTNAFHTQAISENDLEAELRG